MILVRNIGLLLKKLWGTYEVQRIICWAFRYNDLAVIGYLNSDFVGCLNDHKSISEYIFIMVGGAISWKSIKQSVTVTSSMEAEYIACYEATWEVIWLRNFISSLKIVESISRPLTICYDNVVVVSFSHNNKSSTRMKHFDFKHQFVKDKVHEYHTSIRHVSTESYACRSANQRLDGENLSSSCEKFRFS